LPTAEVSDLSWSSPPHLPWRRAVRAAVREQTFREDLFYRLAVIEVSVLQRIREHCPPIGLAWHLRALPALRSGAVSACTSEE